VTEINHTVANGTALTVALQGDYSTSTFRRQMMAMGVLIVDPPARSSTTQ
jgi:hypothetical protein